MNKKQKNVQQSSVGSGEIRGDLKISSHVNMTFNAPVYGVAGNIEGNQVIYSSEQKQTLAQVAEKMQKLLKQLEQNNPTATLQQKKAYVDMSIPTSIKETYISALKAGGETAIEEFVDNHYFNVVKAVIEGWMK